VEGMGLKRIIKCKYCGEYVRKDKYGLWEDFEGTLFGFSSIAHSFYCDGYRKEKFGERRTRKK